MKAAARRWRAIPVLAKLAGAGSMLVAAVLIVTLGASAPAKLNCVGAAARDMHRPCTNPTLSVSPPPGSDGLIPASPCAPVPRQPVCRFGWPTAGSKGTIALFGDSHALHWRAAVDVVARAKRWRALSFTTAGCSFSAVVSHMPPGLREACTDWYLSVQTYLRRHPEIRTVFLGATQATPVIVPPGRTEFSLKVAGYRRGWRTFPKSVKHVIVIRDGPDPADNTFACLERVKAAATEPPGPACATPRASAIHPDAAVAAVKSLHSRRFRSIDLTEFFCDRRNCDPVIGGIQVFNDIYGHVTFAYAKTLGPYMLRKVNAALRP